MKGYKDCVVCKGSGKLKDDENARPIEFDKNLGTAHPGITKREWMATIILSGMFASTPGNVSQSCAYFAIKEADELIKHLNRSNEGSP